MSKNEYRRELVLLRALDSAASGFCRVEARAMRGGIQYSLRLRRQFAGPLHAVLAGARGGVWRAVSGGIIRRGEGEQVNYAWEFDPRSVGGMALEHYSVVGVAEAGSEARLLLAGQLEKGCIVDWASAEQAVRELLGAADDAERELRSPRETENDSETANEAAVDEATVDEAAVEEVTVDEVAVENAEREPSPSNEAETNTLKLPISLYELEEMIERAVKRAVGEACQNDPRTAGAADEPVSSNLTEETDSALTVATRDADNDLVSDAFIEHTTNDEIETVSYDFNEPTPLEIQTINMEDGSNPSESGADERVQSDERQNMLQISEISPELPAPDNAPSIADVRESVAFELNELNTMNAMNAGQCAQISHEASVADHATPLKWALEGICEPDAPWPENCRELRELFLNNPRADNISVPGYTFVNAPLPDECGTPYCAVGVNCRSGVPYSVCFAIPGPHSPLPPAGLEGYKYIPGTDTGFWIVRQYADSGELIFGEE